MKKNSLSPSALDTSCEIDHQNPLLIMRAATFGIWDAFAQGWDLVYIAPRGIRTGCWAFLTFAQQGMKIQRRWKLPHY